MATNFPGSLDAFTNPIASDTLDNPPHDEQHADINDAMEAVQAKLGVGAHTIGTWTTFTPVWTNFTPGNGTVTAAYCEINDLVLVQGSVIFGSTTSVSGLIFINHPVGTAAQAFNSGICRYSDAGTATLLGSVQTNTSNSRFLTLIASTTFVSQGVTSATSPFTWTTSDEIFFQYWYRKV